MKVEFYVPPIQVAEGEWDRHVEVSWPADWPPPAKGDVVYVKDHPLWVGEVTWYPEGNEEDPEPYVWVNLREGR